MEYAHYWEPHMHWGWIIPVLFMILMFACFRRRLAHADRGRWRDGRSARWRPWRCYDADIDATMPASRESASEILDRRYASGEITREEYERMKTDLESGPPSARPDDAS